MISDIFPYTGMLCSYFYMIVLGFHSVRTVKKKLKQILRGQINALQVNLSRGQGDTSQLHDRRPRNKNIVETQQTRIPCVPVRKI